MKQGLASLLKAVAGIAGLVFRLAPITGRGILVADCYRGGNACGSFYLGENGAQISGARALEYDSLPWR